MNRRGITLVELLIVLAIVGILLGLSVPPFFDWVGESRLENKALQLYSDLKWAQALAQEQGNVGISYQVVGGLSTATPLKRRVFVTLESDTDGGYRIYRWQDENSNGLYESGEFDPDFQNTTDLPVKSVATIAPASFGLVQMVDEAACTSDGAEPATAIVNINPCPGKGPLDGTEYCIRFNSKGFFEGLDNAAIYLKSGEHQYALAINITGTIRLCQLVEEDLDGDGDKWDWRIIQ